MARLVWPWDVDAIFGLEWGVERRVRIELSSRFYLVVDAAMRLPAADRDHAVVWAAFEEGMTELRFPEVERWGMRPDRPLPSCPERPVDGQSRISPFKAPEF